MTSLGEALHALQRLGEAGGLERQAEVAHARLLQRRDVRGHVLGAAREQAPSAVDAFLRGPIHGP